MADPQGGALAERRTPSYEPETHAGNGIKHGADGKTGMEQAPSDELKAFAAGDLEAYAARRAAEIGLSWPEAYHASVLENLEILRGHARILAGAEDAAS
jgi:hypothetical protein